MTPDQFHTEDAISKTGLDYIEKSPLDYWWRFLNPEREPHEKDKKTLFDEAFRSAVLTPLEFAKTYAKQPSVNRATKLGKHDYNNFIESVTQNGQIALTATDYDTIIKMRDAVLNHPATEIIFGEINGDPGDPKRFEEVNSGAIVKFCPHWIHRRGNKKIIVNLMSTKDAGRENFSKEALNMKLHKRAALQMDGMRLGMLFVMVENEAPYKLQVHILDDRSVDLGRAVYVRNCITYVKCLKSGIWPGLPEKIQLTSLPDWAFKSY